MAIEVQRAPDLLLAIKRSVDQDQRSGRYLLTGPATVPFGDRLAAIPLQGLWAG